MGMRELQRAFQLIQAHDSDFVGKRSPELVDSAEKAVGFKFPPTYRRFLTAYGCGDINGIEIFGLIDDDFANSGIPDGIWLTLDERRNGLPAHLLLISSEGDGAYCALDSAAMNSDGEYPVVRYEIDGTISPLGEDFGSFLLTEIEATL